MAESSRAFPYTLLNHPAIYALSQLVLAPGAGPAIRAQLKALVQRLPPAERLLDVGCGPASWLSRIGLRPVGVDCSFEYIAVQRQQGHQALVASAERLPFADGYFDAVWSIFLLHHLTDDLARAAVREMLRVCRPGGSVVICDGVLPRHPWRRPVAYAIRRWDRGAFMRREQVFVDLLPMKPAFTVARRTYALNGLEWLVCTTRR